jgi:hypothetical protein
MKKAIFIFSMFLLASGAAAVAQATTSDLIVSSIKAKDGKNTVRLADNKGTVEFSKRGNKFSDVVYIDPAGKSTRLVPVPAGTRNLPKPPCQYPIPDACFAIPNSSKIGMCMCKPTDLSSGEEITVSLLLPAVQAAREAGRISN